MRDVRLRLQPIRQLLHFHSSHWLEEAFCCYIFASNEVGGPQVYNVREMVAVQDGLQALLIGQRVDIDTGGGGHEAKAGGCRRQGLGGVDSCWVETCSMGRITLESFGCLFSFGIAW